MVKRVRVVGVFATALCVAALAIADGTEILGPPSIAIAGGSGIAVGGVGLQEGPADVFVAVPDDAVVKQVLLYWNSEFYDETQPDSDLTVNGIEVVGTPIGGPTVFFSVIAFQTFRADITDLGLVGPGANTLAVTGADSTFRTTGAGVTVIYDNGETTSDISIVDGLDLAYWRFSGVLLSTVPQTFYFDPADVDRVAQLGVHVGSVGDQRPNLTEVTVGGQTYQYFNLFTSMDGPEWDTQLIDVPVPAGASEATVELISTFDDTDRNPASLAWVMGALSIETPPPPASCDECDGKVTTLTLKYQDTTANALVQVYQKKVSQPVFDGIVQPGGTFSFVGKDKNGTLDTEIQVYVNGSLDTKIHTSCSQPIGPGLVMGSFKVVAGESRNGGALCPLETPPDGDCGPCDGKVSNLRLKYVGNTPGAMIEVLQKKIHDPVFSGTVEPGMEFVFSGKDKKNTLGTEIEVYVNGGLNTRIHTSCSQPIGPGLVFGDFLVVSGASRNGGELCPVDGPGEPGSDLCDDGKPVLLSMVYMGESCGATNNSQDPGKVSCDGDPAFTPQVRIIATDKDDPFHDKAYIYFDGIVGLGETFDLDAEAAGLSRLKSETRVFIYDLDGNLLQAVVFHTSCSQPLVAGDQFGSLTLVGLVAEGGRSSNAVIDNTPTDNLAQKPSGAGCAPGGTAGSRWGDALMLLATLSALVAATRRPALDS